MTVFEWAIAFWIALGMVAFSAWSVRVFVTSQPAATAGWTTKLVYRSGQVLIWLAALAIAGAVFGVIARAAWSLFAA